MSDQEQPPTIPGQLALSTYISGMDARGELLPGAKAYLEKRFSCSNEHGGLKALVGFLHHEQGKRYLNSEREQGKPEAVLRAMARRFAGVLRKGEADELYNAFALDLADLAEREPGKAAQELWARMRSFEHRGRWLEKHRPPLPRREAAVVAVLEDLEHALTPLAHARREDIAHEWAYLVDNNKTTQSLAQAIASKLSYPDNLHLLQSGEPLKYGDWAGAGERQPDAATAGLRDAFIRSGNYDPL